MTVSQAQKAERFRLQHEGPGAFIMPNPWDAGAARVLAALGFSALATSSGALAGTFGRRDGRVKREEALAHARAVAGAGAPTAHADTCEGFGQSPTFVAGAV